MCTEDYVNFETAKLLKEKGFDEKTERVWFHYIEANEWQRISFNSCCDKFTEDKMLHSPTLQMAMKWLREVHKWSIQVFPCFDDLEWWYDIYELKIQDWNSRPELLSDVGYSTYEEACEAAIKYCLTKLI